MKKKKNTKPSPLRNYWGKDYDAKDMSGDISGAMDRFSSIDASENLWAGAKNQFADVSNAFQGIQQDFTNRFEGVNIKDPTRDLTNRFQGLQNRFAENVYEDLTVNQQQAQFETQQGQQQRANIMQQMGGAAGGSGIASLAQMMANQGQQSTQRIAAGIGQQEAANQRLRGQGALQVQRGAAALDTQRAAGATAVDTQQAQAGMQINQMNLAQQQQMLAEGGRVEQLKMQAQLAEAGGSMQAQLAQATGASEAQKLQLQGAADARDLMFEKAQGQLSFLSGLSAQEQEMEIADDHFWSDRKLKQNIVFIKKSPSGLNIYNFEYKDSKMGEGVYQGVMSGEVPKEAVVKNSNGYDMVDYSKIDVNFVKIKN